MKSSLTDDIFNHTLDTITAQLSGDLWHEGNELVHWNACVVLFDFFQHFIIGHIREPQAKQSKH